MKKIISVILCVLMMSVLLTGCMNSGGRTLDLNTQKPDAMPDPTSSMMPGPTGSGLIDAIDNASSNAVNALPFDWMKNAQTVQAKINQLSEIQSSTVVVNNNTALVGIAFTNSYAGELTQRIHDLVAAQVMDADASIQTVAVTADKEDVKAINELAARIQAGTPSSDLEQEIDSIARNVTTMQ